MDYNYETIGFCSNLYLARTNAPLNPISSPNFVTFNLEEALQVLGGIGYTKEFPLERYFRDVKIAQIGGRTAEILQYLIQREIYNDLGL